MDTKDISLFLTIARLGSISRTADQMFMSQSTVTAHLQRLERTLGYPLFHRLPTGVQLTKEGQQLIPLAERMAALEEEILHPEPLQTPVLRIMSGRAFVSADVPECLHRMARRTRVHLKVRMGMYDDMMQALLSNQVDFCFLGEPIYHAQIRQLEFLPDVIDLIVPVGHRFTRDFPGIHALNREPFVAFGRSSSPFRRRMMNLLAREDIYPQVQMELDSIDGIKAMVGHGLGVSLLPRRTLHDAQFKSYVPIPLHDPRWTRPTLLAFPAEIEHRPLTQQFIDVVTEYYQSVSGSTPERG
ncbi:MAG: LysR family transcriptional regulator [Alicyclobacillus sp.]|nr:LysR family transcriptional regulator [Alicyclobacillus sp.]